MTIDEKLVDHLAHLARLDFEPDAKSEIIKDLNRILAFVEKLNEVDTTGVEPLIYMVDEPNQVREDVSRVDISRDDALQNAPKHDSDYFRVPKVIE
jgi:aspartyl-tRNA(Asn)/glutamyl-tRNA(Gln) amidotransferase subunit C